jgi:hypothetical protein
VAWRDGVGGGQSTGDGLDRGALQVQVGCVIGHLVRLGVMQEGGCHQRTVPGLDRRGRCPLKMGGDQVMLN